MNEKWIEQQRRRWARGNAHLYVRADAYRFAAPDAAHWRFPLDARWDPLGTLSRKYSENQPRVPRGNPGGGQWTTVSSGGGISIAVPSGGGLLADDDEEDDTDFGAGSDSDGVIELPEIVVTSDGDAPDDLGSDGTGGGANVQLAGGGRSSGIRGGRYGENFPGATFGQMVRLDLNIGRTENLLQRIWRYDPNWRPRTTSWVAPGSVEGAIGDSEARAEEADAHLQELRSGNFASPLESQAPPTRAFDGQAWINGYRATNNSRDLFGNPTWAFDRGTVAVSELDGKLYFGVNSGAPGYSNQDRTEADNFRAIALERYPEDLEIGNIGQIPNDAFYHAESTALIRMAESNGGMLLDRIIEIHTDRPMCSTSCPLVLPKLGLLLGNPRVTFVDQYGNARTMIDGRWE